MTAVDPTHSVKVTRTPLADGPLSGAERAWVTQALDHRAARARSGITQFWQTALFVALLIPCGLFGAFWLEGALDKILRGVGAWVLLGCVVMGAGILYLIWRSHRGWVRALQTLTRAQVPADPEVIYVRGRITVDEDLPFTAHIVEQDTRRAPPLTQAIQIPDGWAHRLSGRYDMRVVRVEASGDQVTARSVIKGAMSPGGMAFGLPRETQTYTDPLYVLCAAGPLSVHDEIETGPGLPQGENPARLSMAAHWGAGAALLGALLWAAADAVALDPTWLGGLLGLCAAVQLGWIIPTLRRRARRRALDRFYRTRTDDGS